MGVVSGMGPRVERDEVLEVHAALSVTEWLGAACQGGHAGAASGLRPGPHGAAEGGQVIRDKSAQPGQHDRDRFLLTGVESCDLAAGDVVLGECRVPTAMHRVQIGRDGAGTPCLEMIGEQTPTLPGEVVAIAEVAESLELQAGHRTGLREDEGCAVSDGRWHLVVLSTRGDRFRPGREPSERAGRCAPEPLVLALPVPGNEPGPREAGGAAGGGHPGLVGRMHGHSCSVPPWRVR
jgi:hypothetical protein